MELKFIARRVVKECSLPINIENRSHYHSKVSIFCSVYTHLLNQLSVKNHLLRPCSQLPLHEHRGDHVLSSRWGNKERQMSSCNRLAQQQAGKHLRGLATALALALSRHIAIMSRLIGRHMNPNAGGASLARFAPSPVALLAPRLQWKTLWMVNNRQPAQRNATRDGEASVIFAGTTCNTVRQAR